MPFDVRTSGTPGQLRTGGGGTGAGETEPQNTSQATTEVGVYSGFHRKTLEGFKEQSGGTIRFLF